MTTRLIYLDTTVWNVLAEQSPDGKAACALLEKLDTRIALGMNAYFEMLKSFFGKRSDRLERGKRLFRCVHSYLDSGAALVKTWEELLVEEVARTKGSVAEISPFSNMQWQRKVTQQALQLSQGRLHPQTRKLVEEREGQSNKARMSAGPHIDRQLKMVADFQQVAPSEIAHLLAREGTGRNGQRLLSKYLKQVFPSMSLTRPRNSQQLAATLLSSTSNKAAHAVVRSDIYQNWRAAQRKSSDTSLVKIAKCIPDDSYHVVNACYCDVFVTEDKDGQASAAQCVLPELTVLIYRDQNGPVLDWLAAQLAI